MVHKKSEYRLKFHNLTNEVRAQIWRENVMFRELQKRMNTSEHYWRYQLIDDSCDCDDESDAEINYRTSNGLNGFENSVPKKIQNNLFPLEEKAVQTPDWGKVAEASSPTLGASDGSEDNKVPTANNSATECPTLEQKSAFSVTEESENLRKPTNMSDCVPSRDRVLVKDHSKVLKEAQSPDMRVVASHLNPLPTRNKLQSYISEQNIVPTFAAYGWNESHKNVGDQKTYNIRAPLNQVHHSALLASSKRRQELEQYFAEQMKQRRNRQSLISLGPVNFSSIWMTEYQESFSKGQREPLKGLSRSVGRPTVWRHS